MTRMSTRSSLAALPKGHPLASKSKFDSTRGTLQTANFRLTTPNTQLRQSLPLGHAQEHCNNALRQTLVVQEANLNSVTLAQFDVGDAYMFLATRP